MSHGDVETDEWATGASNDSFNSLNTSRILSSDSGYRKRKRRCNQATFTFVALFVLVLLLSSIFKDLVRITFHTPSIIASSLITPYDDAPLILSTCRVIIDHRGTYSHFEIIESIIRDLPIASLPSTKCKVVVVDIYFNSQYLPLDEKQRITGFLEYAEDHMRQKVYHHGPQQRHQQIRVLGQLERRWAYDSTNAAAVIISSAYCRRNYLNHLQKSSSNYAIFHEICPEAESFPNAYWVTPMHPRYIFPNVLPEIQGAEQIRFQRRTDTSGPEPTYQLCVIGDTQRRNYDFLQHYLESEQEKEDSTNLQQRRRRRHVRIQLLGRGAIPPQLESFSDMISQRTTPSFLKYEELVATECHVILALLDSETKPNYFPNVPGSKRKLSGAITQASAYGIPMVLHEDLLEVYAPYLRLVETHSNEVATFGKALNRLLKKLDEMQSVGEATRTSVL